MLRDSEEIKHIQFNGFLLLNKSKSLEEKYSLKLEKLEELKSGILKRAFENELIEAE